MISFRNGLTFAVTLSSACVLDELTPAGKPCPCPATYTCDTAQNLCVEIATSTESTGSTDSTTSGSTSTGPAVCAGTCGTPGCSACPEVAMIDGGLGFTIDATETPRGDYVRFLADAVDVTTQGPACAWNVSFATASVDDCAGYDPTVQPQMPITCVDWCDAVAFCKWAGKHLCGKIGGGTVPSSGVNDAAASEWYAACSEGGTQTFPYGNMYTAELCNEAGGGGEVFVGSYPECNGGFPGVFDMVGNVEEWEDACSISATPEGDDCQIRGGGFWSKHDEPGEEWAQCTSIGRTTDRASWSHDWGFRCCDTP